MSVAPTGIREISGTTVVLAGQDIDTDRIIPARFLKHLTFTDLGRHVFEDDRKQMTAAGRTHPFDDPARQNASILLTAANFGCGSSREHAPQALKRWGLSAVVGESFGEIFHGNCASIGLPCVSLNSADAAEARAVADSDPHCLARLDLVERLLVIGERRYPIQINESLRTRFVDGTWDTLTELAANLDAVRATAPRIPYFNGWQTDPASAGVR
ncbi:3-isopropylmalate dehydratase small subunit [Actinoallomurus sp. NPDC052274]|uniref:3-isopropylmalate dehydratase small subunit n=1 Tax=Actinoallomurus sp. NPDC052274 TaxID=3155420 RepID=UPI00341CFDB6